MTVKMVEVKAWFKVRQKFVMPAVMCDGMTESDWYKMFRESVLDGEVDDWDIEDIEEIEPEDDDARD